MCTPPNAFQSLPQNPLACPTPMARVPVSQALLCPWTMHPSEWLSYPASEGVPNGSESMGLFVKGSSQEASQTVQTQEARLPGTSGTTTIRGHYDRRNQGGQQQGCVMYVKSC